MPTHDNRTSENCAAAQINSQVHDHPMAGSLLLPYDVQEPVLATTQHSGAGQILLHNAMTLQIKQEFCENYYRLWKYEASTLTE